MRIQKTILLFGLVLLVGGSAAALAQREEPEITTDSEEARSLYWQGMDYTDQLRHALAQQCFRSAVRLDPEFSMSWLRLSVAARESGQADSAIIFIEEARRYADRITDRERLKVEMIWANAQGDAGEATAKAEALLQKYPDDVETLFYLFGYARMRGDFEAGYQSMQRVIEIDPYYFLAYNEMGYILADMGRLEEALLAFQKYAFIDSDEANPHDSLGELYERVGRYDDARTEYHRAVVIDSLFHYAPMHEVRVLQRLGRFEEAHALLVSSPALAATPEVSFSRDVSLCWLAIDRGDFAQAERQLAAFGPLPRGARSESLWIAADIAFGRGDREALRRCAERAREIAAKFPEDLVLRDYISRAEKFSLMRLAVLDADYGQAVALADSLVSRHPEWPVEDFIRAQAAEYSFLGARYDEVLRWTDPIVARNERMPVQQYWRGRAFEAEGRMSEAAAAYGIVVEVLAGADPGNQWYDDASARLSVIGAS